MRIFLAILLTLASTAAPAAYSARFDRGVVSVGDSAAGVIQRAGRPDRIVRLENHRGGAVGERWEYYFRDKQVNVVLTGGRVTDISEFSN